MLKRLKLFDRRKTRNRYRLKENNKHNRLRLSVFKSGRHFHAQIIDDISAKTLVSASSLEFIKEGIKTYNREAAKKVGEILAKRASEAGIEKVVFDRGPYAFHGKVMEFANSVREKLKF